MTDLRIDKTTPSLARHEQKAACHLFEISDDLLGSASVDGEDEQTLTLLNDLGVSHVQGYHLARPAPISDVLRAHDEH